MQQNKINKERFISHLLRHGYLDRPEDFDKIMQIIPSTARCKSQYKIDKKIQN